MLNVTEGSSRLRAAHTTVETCRAGGGELIDVLSLGDQVLTGIFPRVGEQIGSAPLTLAWSPNSGLLQLRHSCSLVEMYGDNYGYRTGLNGSMVRHVERKVAGLKQQAKLAPGDVVLDIGSNDGTLLGCYGDEFVRVGIDPTIKKFGHYYQPGIHKVADFFSADRFRDVVGGRKASVITSLAMFYDLEDPIGFAEQVGDCLAPDGIWHLEMHYLGAMLRDGVYDAVCHEHLEYYSLTSLCKILNAAGFYVADLRVNEVNGGSLAITARKQTGVERACPYAAWLFAEEARLGEGTREPFDRFAARVERHRESLRGLLERLNEAGKRVIAYGASTKGNVVLQYCGIGPELVQAVAEVNPDKFGCVTPGSNIPIISEAEARAMRPDYFLVLPWHFRTGLIEREREYLASGGRMIFPFPSVEIV